MLIDTAALSPGTVLRADLCIVGAGAAGITIARRLAGSGLDVVVLEGGGFKPTEESQELYEGEMVSVYREGTKREPYDRRYVSRSRLRYFGGTTNHWNGWCRPLEPWDFEVRDWVPHSGWPISRTDLDPWYDQALGIVEIGAYEKDEGYSRKEGRRMVALKQSERIATRIFQWSPPTRFGATYRQALVGAPRIRVLLKANVLALRCPRDEARVDRAEVAIEGGARIEVRARSFVLACGGIENPRLLLQSDQDRPAGLGNDNDQVGRYFMDHPHLPKAGQIVVTDEHEVPGFTELYFRARKEFRRKNRSFGVFITTPEVQRKEQLLGFSMQLRDQRKSKLNKTGKAVLELASGINDLSGGTDPAFTPYAGRLFARGEHAPNPDSRVTLGKERDRLGLRKVRLDWQITERDRYSIRRSMEIFAEEVGADLFGRVRIRMSPAKDWGYTLGGDHHIGTTRMHEDPKRGVVNAQSRVHGLANLYIAGSSVFPTCGFSNPTFTIVALALRLADHLKQAVKP